ncbi:rhomboid family intramembrane serine protease [Corynebacterium suedekumii]|uniref:Rhomboid family intramembrane serine protease n=1 Tax=Corynebacterium suedekumii TaxID=3049801 RepID=A0ABY8VNC4_9CORY|nr:rhomboid family intramembrane serine protease [Corynebacterium suedekumii]WIM70491.1 rhomboid family intramembrane serine protease [Corynebacterium suedekumii]WIM71952.1 rhomboid family intramembrane serine protease [Corynebacterium suedekumii]
MSQYPMPNPYQQPYQPLQPSPTAPAPSLRETARRRFRSGLSFAALYVIVIWAVHLINGLLFGGVLIFFGIHPLDLSSIWHIFTSPLLHADFGHLISNTVPGAVFSFLIGMSGKRVWWEVLAFVVIVGGLGTWLLGGVGTNHIGASGLVYGWLGYLLVRGIFNRSLPQILVGVVLGVFYSGLVWGVLPGTPGVSWQAHLFGALGGILAGMLITSDDPPALKARRERKALERGRRS